MGPGCRANHRHRGHERTCHVGKLREMRMRSGIYGGSIRQWSSGCHRNGKCLGTRDGRCFSVFNTTWRRRRRRPLSLHEGIGAAQGSETSGVVPRSPRPQSQGRCASEGGGGGAGGESSAPVHRRSLRAGEDGRTGGLCVLE